MSRVRPCLTLALALAFALASARGSMASLAETDASDPRAQDHVDAAALYDAGTEALARGDLGPAVTFLLAAYRIDPRARDIRTNLGIARARVEAAEGSVDHGMPPAPPPFALSPAESWHLAAALALAGALVAWMAAARPRARRLLLAGSALFAAGMVFSGALLLRAREEAAHPSAVVVAPVLEVGPAPDERPLPPYLLGAGDEVRLGPSRSDLVQVRVGGNTIGWAKGSGLWRVVDAPRYTRNSGAR